MFGKNDLSLICDFLFKLLKKLKIWKTSLDKELYYHGESINVNVHIANNSNRTVKKIKVSVRQFADICIFATAQYKCIVAEVESEDGCTIGPGVTLSKVFTLIPLLINNKDKFGLALDGRLKDEDTNLASSTIITDKSLKENLGIIVQYKVKVKLYFGPIGGELAAELPFTLMHPKPPDEFVTKNVNQHANDNDMQIDSSSSNLIQLDTDGFSNNQVLDDDDIIFEDFARLRLKGGDETDA